MENPRGECARTAAARDQLWLRGGFPDAYLAASDAESLALRRDFIRTYLERDIPQFGPRIPAASLERLWTLLAHHQGALLNASQLARALELSAQTVTRYIDLLVDLLLVRRLPPLHTNVAKRLVRSPKVYIRDTKAHGNRRQPSACYPLRGLKNFRRAYGAGQRVKD